MEQDYEGLAAGLDPQGVLPYGYDRGQVAASNVFYRGLYQLGVPPTMIQNMMRPPQPLEQSEEEPVYVNSKQYRRILLRRAARARLEAQSKIAGRKPFLHDSRHRHAKTRQRGPSGRFLTREELAAQAQRLPEGGGASLGKTDEDGAATSTTGETGDDGSGIVVQDGEEAPDDLDSLEPPTRMRRVDPLATAEHDADEEDESGQAEVDGDVDDSILKGQDSPLGSLQDPTDDNDEPADPQDDLL